MHGSLVLQNLTAILSASYENKVYLRKQRYGPFALSPCFVTVHAGDVSGLCVHLLPFSVIRNSVDNTLCLPTSARTGPLIFWHILRVSLPVFFPPFFLIGFMK